MTEIPSPENPLIVVSTSDKGIPSMKNDNRLDLKRGKLRRSGTTNAFLRGFPKKVQAAMEHKGFTQLPPDVPISLVVYMKMPSQDGDNVFTTVQETMQKSLVHNDRMVKFGAFVVNDIGIGMTQMGVAFAWALPESAKTDKDTGFEELIRFYNAIYKNRAISSIIAEYMKGL